MRKPVMETPPPELKVVVPGGGMKRLALELAVHFGNLTGANAKKIVETAKLFEAYLSDGQTRTEA